MPLNELINTYLDKQCINNTIKDINIKKDIISHPKKHISKHKLTSIIHKEFQKTHIKKLYPNNIWTNRVFWVVANNIENNNENVELYEIIHELRKYLINHNLPIPIIDWSKWVDISDEWKQISIEFNIDKPNFVNKTLSQHDQVKLIRDIIRNTQQDYEGKAPLDQILPQAVYAGIDEDKVMDIIRQLKREGVIFEPRNGYLKST